MGLNNKIRMIKKRARDYRTERTLSELLKRRKRALGWERAPHEMRQLEGAEQARLSANDTHAVARYTRLRSRGRARYHRASLLR
jgi:hypothetical protein